MTIAFPHLPNNRNLWLVNGSDPNYDTWDDVASRWQSSTPHGNRFFNQLYSPKNPCIWCMFSLHEWLNFYGKGRAIYTIHGWYRLVILSHYSHNLACYAIEVFRHLKTQTRQFDQPLKCFIAGKWWIFFKGISSAKGLLSGSMLKFNAGNLMMRRLGKGRCSPLEYGKFGHPCSIFERCSRCSTKHYMVCIYDF